ncbi:hypothetical protein SEA_NIKE_57 [Microbacterium phage Nike]|nr:hypothetical protein SEA_NIKE_57 [Microbacterium phage Nike]
MAEHEVRVVVEYDVTVEADTAEEAVDIARNEVEDGQHESTQTSSFIVE